MKERLRKWFLKWLFDTDDIKYYYELTNENHLLHRRLINILDHSAKTHRQYVEDLNMLRKLIKICKNHHIDVENEIEDIILEDEVLP